MNMKQTTLAACVAAALNCSAQAAQMIHPPKELFAMLNTAPNGKVCWRVAAGAMMLLSLKQEGKDADAWVAKSMQRYIDAGWALDDAHVKYAMKTFQWARLVPQHVIDKLEPVGHEAQQAAVAIAVMRNCTQQDKAK